MNFNNQSPSRSPHFATARGGFQRANTSFSKPVPVGQNQSFSKSRFDDSSRVLNENDRSPFARERKSNYRPIQHGQSMFYTPKENTIEENSSRPPLFRGGDTSQRSLRKPVGAKSVNQTFNSFREQDSSMFTYPSQPQKPSLMAGDLPRHNLNTIQEVNQSFESQKSYISKIEVNLQTTRDLIESKSFAEKQNSILDVRQSIEKMAAVESNPQLNDIQKQFGEKPKHFEFDPVQFQIGSSMKHPQVIDQALKDLQSKQMDQKASPMQRLQYFNGCRHLIDNVYCLIVDKRLHLWESGQTDNGLNTYRSGNNQRMQAQCKYHDFDEEIQSVLYVESGKLKFKPSLIVATKTKIEMYEFQKKDGFEESKNPFKLKRNDYNLLDIVQSHYASLILDENEEIGQIIHLSKSDRIFYSSHKNDYYQVYIKELEIQEPSQIEKPLDMQFQGQIQKKITEIQISGKNMIIQAKDKVLGIRRRLISKPAQESNKVVQTLKHNVIPTFLNFGLKKKAIIQMEVDQQRNLVYCLTNRIVTMVVDQQDQQIDEDEIETYQIFGESDLEIYDLGMLSTDFNLLTKITFEQINAAIKKDSGLGFWSGLAATQAGALKGLSHMVSVHPIHKSESQDIVFMITLLDGKRLYLDFTHWYDYNLPSKAEIKQAGLQFDDFQLSRPNGNRWRLAYEEDSPKILNPTEQYQRDPNPFHQILLTGREHIRIQPQDEFHILPLGYFTDDVVMQPPIYDQETSTCVTTQTHPIDGDNQYLNIQFVSKNESHYCDLRIENGFQINYIPESYSILKIPKEEYDEVILSIKPQSKLGMHANLSKQSSIQQQRLQGGVASMHLDKGDGIKNELWYMPLNTLEKQLSPCYLTNHMEIATNKRVLSVINLRPIDQLFKILEQINTQMNESFMLKDFQIFVLKYSIQEVCQMLVTMIANEGDHSYVVSKKLDKVFDLTKFKSQPRQGQINSPPNRPSISRSKYEEKDMPFVYKKDEYNCYIRRFDPNNNSNHLLSIAAHILNIYGNCVTRIEKDDNKFSLPIKFKAIQLYLQRILRPVWDLNIAYQKGGDLISSYPLFEQAGKQLRNLQIYLERNLDQLLHVATLEEHIAFIKPDSFDVRNIDESQIEAFERMMGCTFLHRINFEARDKIKLKMKTNLDSMLIFIQRTVDIINFLGIVSFMQGETLETARQRFSTMQTLISKDKQDGANFNKELHQTKFYELVVSGGSSQGLMDNEDLVKIQLVQRNALINEEQGSEKNSFIRRFFHYFTKTQSYIEQDILKHMQLNPKQNSMKVKAEQLQKLCPTLFTKDQMNNYLGECLIKNAAGEKNSDSKQRVLQEGVDYLLRTPETIDLKKTVMDLAKSDAIHQIFTITLFRLRWLKQQKDHNNLLADEKLACYDIILEIFTGLDQRISDQKDVLKFDNSQSKLKSVQQFEFGQNKLVFSEKETEWQRFFQEHMLKNQFFLKRDMNNQIKLFDELMNLVEDTHDETLLKTVFNYLLTQHQGKLKLDKLPKISFNSFEEVIKRLTQGESLRHQTVDLCLKILSKPGWFLSDHPNSMQFQTCKRLCSLVIHICRDNNIKVMKDDARHTTCDDKKKYCQIALDSIENAKSINNIEEQGYLQNYQDQITKLFGDLSLQILVIQAMQERLGWLQGIPVTQDVKLEHNKIEQDLKHMSTINYNKEQLLNQFIEQYSLSSLHYQELVKEFKVDSDIVSRLNSSHQSIYDTGLVEDIEKRFIQVFISHLNYLRKHLDREQDPKKFYQEVYKEFEMAVKFAQSPKVFETILLSTIDALKKGDDDLEYDYISQLEKELDKLLKTKLNESSSEVRLIAQLFNGIYKAISNPCQKFSPYQNVVRILLDRFKFEAQQVNNSDNYSLDSEVYMCLFITAVYSWLNQDEMAHVGSMERAPESRISAHKILKNFIQKNQYGVSELSAQIDAINQHHQQFALAFKAGYIQKIEQIIGKIHEMSNQIQ